MRKWVLGMCVAVLPATVAADPVALHDGFGYSDAVLRAELMTLRDMSGASGPRRHLGAAGYHRVRGELDASNRADRYRTRWPARARCVVRWGRSSRSAIRTGAASTT